MTADRRVHRRAERRASEPRPGPRRGALDQPRVGAYHHLTLVAPGIAERTRPGQLRRARGRRRRRPAMLLRRAFSIYRVSSRGRLRRHRRDRVRRARRRAPRGWPRRSRTTPVDVVGPLGRPFALPKEPVACALVGGGYGSAPLFALAEQLRARGCRGRLRARRRDRGPALRCARGASGSAQSVAVTTDDGSVGDRGPGHRRAARR